MAPRDNILCFSTSAQSRLCENGGTERCVAVPSIEFAMEVASISVNKLNNLRTERRTPKAIVVSKPSIPAAFTYLDRRLCAGTGHVLLQLTEHVLVVPSEFVRDRLQHAGKVVTDAP